VTRGCGRSRPGENLADGGRCGVVVPRMSPPCETARPLALVLLSFRAKREIFSIGVRFLLAGARRNDTVALVETTLLTHVEMTFHPRRKERLNYPQEHLKNLREPRNNPRCYSRNLCTILVFQKVFGFFVPVAGLSRGVSDYIAGVSDSMFSILSGLYTHRTMGAQYLYVTPYSLAIEGANAQRSVRRCK